MTREENLLLKDLSARLPYGVKCYGCQIKIDGNDIECYGTLKGISNNDFGWKFTLNDRVSLNGRKCYDESYSEVKPYLFPLSSMSKEQKKELKELCDMYTPDDDYNPYAYMGIKVLYKHVLDDDYEFNFNGGVVIN